MKVGAIGVGEHASENLHPNLAAAGLELVAVCARHQDRAEAAAARWGAARAFDDAAEMLAATDLEGIIVCVAADDYAPLIDLCLEAGRPVYCEKPGAASAAEAERLAARSEEAGVPIVVGYMKRFAPAYRRAREIVRSAEFGPPTLGAFTFAMGQWPEDSLRDYLIDNPGHHLDLARDLLGELGALEAQVTELPGFGWAVAAIARASSGAVCTFSLCTTASWEQRNEHVEVFGRGHAVWVENVDTCVHRPPEGPERTWRPTYTVPLPENSSAVAMGFVPALEHFRAVAAEGAENRSDMASAAKTLALAEQLCEIAGA
jgi:predicted dehydrogenase